MQFVYLEIQSILKLTVIQKENLVHLILHRLFSRKSTIAIFLLLMLVLYVDMRQLIKMETRK